MAQIARSGFVWHELMTTDTEKAEKFYREVAGLTAAPGPYRMLFSGEQPVGGLVGPRAEGPGWPSGGPEPHWIAYIGVEDVDAAARRAGEMGGRCCCRLPTSRGLAGRPSCRTPRARPSASSPHPQRGRCKARAEPITGAGQQREFTGAARW